MAGRQPFKQRLKHSLENPDIPIALRRGLSTLLERRNALFAPDEFATVQRDIGEIKRAAIARLPELVEQFTAEATRVGAQVHLAATVADAQRIIGEIAARHGGKLAVKSKSMATEEIELNDYLERQGIEVVETDLGEWIIQLAREHPSHLIAPAIHMTRERIAALFSREAGEPLPPETQALVKFARKTLREKFIAADLGITGANIGIASTGTIAIVTNEGNADMVTTLPPVHIAVLGIEKIVPTLDEATQILKVLARNAAGQRFSTYVNMITGPSRTGDIEMELAVGVHGPLEQHIVLLDNGRWQTREDPDLIDALSCIRCGACANVCPPYAVVGGHAFGHIYTGPIGLVLTAMHHGLDAAGPPNTLCASCNACERICPAAIPIPRQIIDVRQRYVAAHGLPLQKRAAVAVIGQPKLQQLGRLGQRPFVRGRQVQWLPLVNEQLSWRSLPALASPPFRRRNVLSRPAPPLVPGSQAIGMRVAYFPACLTDLLEPDTGEAAVQVLRAAGCEVSIPDSWTCCGLVAHNAGDAVQARRLLKETITALERDTAHADAIVTTSTSCAVMLLQDGLHLLRGEPQWRERAERLAHRIFDFTRFVDFVVAWPDGALAGESSAEPVTYHDACQSGNCLGLGEEPRNLLQRLCGLEVREMAESGVCCGFGGTFSLQHPRVARQVLERKLVNAEATGAPRIVMDNPGCLMHIRGGLAAQQRPQRAAHLAEVLAERLPRAAEGATDR